MRTKAITLWLFVVLHVGNVGALAQNNSDPNSRLALLRFETNAGQECQVSVDEVTPTIPRRHLAVSCGGKIIGNYTTEDHLLDVSRDSAIGDRILSRWEGGAHFRVVVFLIKRTGGSLAASLVFDEALDFAPDFLVSPDLLLVYRDKRFVKTALVPTRTDVYQWTGNEYKLTKSYHWNESMRLADRFCVLDTENLSCPATQITAK
jgi:hypothetical protein